MSLAERFGTHQNTGGGFGQGSLVRRFSSQDDEWEERGILLVNKRTGETKPKPIPGGKPAYVTEKPRSFLGNVGSALSEDVKLLGAGMAETAAGLGEFATGESGFGPSRVARELGQKVSGLAAPSPMKAASSAIRGYAGERVSRLGEIGAELGVGPLATAAHAAGVRTGGQLIDILPLGRLSKAPAQALQRGLAPRSAPPPIQALDPDLIELQRASLAIGEPPASGFRTAQGSTYEVLPSGGTRRTKVPHVGHLPDDVGPKAPSVTTLYADPEGAKQVGWWQASSAPGRRAIVRGDEVILTSENPQTGQRGLDGRFKVSRSPEVGKSPVELWEPDERGWFRGSHPGSPITELFSGKSESREALAHAGEDVSPEALRRVASGQRFYRVRPGGEAVPILSDVGAVDVRVNPGEVKVAVGADGVTTLLDGRPNAAQQRRIAAGFEAGPVRPTEPAPEVELDLGATAGDEDFLRSMGVERPAAALATPPKPAAAEAGHIRTGGLKDWLESNLLSGGPFRAAARGFAKPEQQAFVRSLPKEIEGMEGRVASRVQAARYAIEDLEDAVRASTPDEGAARKLFQDLYGVRLRRKPWREVPEAVRPFAKSLFKIVDRTSIEMRDAGALPPSLKDVVTKRLGRYFHRGYAAFDDPRWREKMEGGEAWREAEGFLKGELPDAEPAEIQGILNALTDREQGVRRFLVTGGAPTRVNAILQKRQAIPEPLRKLMGEYTDVRQVAEKTVESMAYDLEVYKLLRGMKDKGEALGVFRQSGEPSGEVYRKILGPDLGDFGDRHPLSDMLTTTGLKKALVGTFEEAKNTTWTRVAGWVKGLKTWGSVQGLNRNTLSHNITTIANGRNPVNPQRWGQVRGVFKDRAQFLRATELGIANEGASSREVAEFIKMVENPDAPAIVRGVVRTAKGAQKLWRLGDDVWRIYNWLGETDDLVGAGIPRIEAEAMAADRVRDMFPTYGRAPQIASKMRRNPLFFPFPTFPIEMTRNAGNIARTALSDIRRGMATKNPALVKLGVRRALGFPTAVAFATGLGTLGRAKSGTTDEQEAAFRRQVAPHFLKNSEIVFWSFEPGEEATVADFSFLNSFAVVAKPTIAFTRALDEGKPPLGAITEYLEQIVGLELLATTAGEEMFNRRVDDTLPPRVGGEIYPTDMGPAALAREAGYHAWRGLAPGTALSAENLARGLQGEEWVPGPIREALPTAKVSSGVTRKLGTEALALAGPRVTSYNLETAFQRRIKDIGDRYGKVAGRTKSEAKRVGPEPSVARDYATGTVNLWRELDQIVKDARTLEVPEGVLVEAMRDARLARWFRSSFLGSMPDVPPGLEVDPETYDLIRQAYSRRRAR